MKSLFPRPAASRLLALPLALGMLTASAAVWTRSASLFPIPRGTRQDLRNASYFTRDWTIAIASVAVRDDDTGVAGTVSPVWVFLYRNTDRDPHYVAITVECQDRVRQPTTRYRTVAKLEPNRKDDTPLEITLKAPADNWRRSSVSKLTIDFLSGPES